MINCFEATVWGTLLHPGFELRILLLKLLETPASFPSGAGREGGGGMIGEVG